MKVAIKVLLWLTGLILTIYVAICAFFYFSQDKIIFPANKLAADYQFDYPSAFKEYSIKTGTGTLSGLLFKADSAKGLIFYLHGNGGALDTWGSIAPAYTALHTTYLYWIIRVMEKVPAILLMKQICLK